MVPTYLAYLTIFIREILHSSSTPNLIRDWQSFTTILHPTAFPMIQVEPSRLVHHFEGRRKRGHQQRRKDEAATAEVISISARNRLEKVWGGRVSWNDRVFEPTEDGIECHCK